MYKKLDIGTAKPSLQERAELAHHVIDIADIHEQFGVGEFMSKADLACRDIFSRNKMPLLVGGSGFYIRTFLYGLPQTPESTPHIRERLQKDAKEKGLPALFADLQKNDPLSAQKINRHDAYRIIRALEVFYTSGKPLSSYTIPADFRNEFDFLILILMRERKELYSRIDQRVDAMFSNGLPAEILALEAAGGTKDSAALKAIGYKEFFLPQNTGWKENAALLEDIKAHIKHNSHRYAKKQYTYIQGIPEAHILDAASPTVEQEACRLIHPFFSHYVGSTESLS